jgi:probable phosphoglycerate mutase
MSDPQEGCRGWGLVPEAAALIRKSLGTMEIPENSLFFSSPFLRAVETARIAAEGLSSAELSVEPGIVPALRERFFGSYDKTPDKNYPRVWERDALNSDNHETGVESPAEVLHRMRNFIVETDSLFSGRVIILVSHGDPLNMLLCYASGLPVEKHRDIPSMKTAELRNLIS